MFDIETLGIIAELGLGLAGFSGVALVLTSAGAELSRLEKDRLGIMLGSALGATFLALLPIVVSAAGAAGDVACRVASGIMAAYTAGFLRYYVTATLQMRSQAPELVTPLPFGSVIAGHGLNLGLQSAAALGFVACAPAYLVGLVWLLFHGAYQFGRILFIRPRGTITDGASEPAPADVATALPGISSPATAGNPQGDVP